MLLIDKIRKEIGDPPEGEGHYTSEQERIFKLAVEAKAKRIREKAQPWEYIAVPYYSGGPMGGLTWEVFTSECKPYRKAHREPLHRFSALYEEIAINLAADLSTAAELRRYRDEQKPDDLVQLDVPEDDFLLSPIDPVGPKPSLIPPPKEPQ